jgi:hypothetical protein
MPTHSGAYRRREYSRMPLTRNDGRLKRLTKETTQLGSLGWDRGRGRSNVLDDAPGLVEITLTETPDTEPCTQGPVSWRNGAFSLMWIASDLPRYVPSQRSGLGRFASSSTARLSPVASRLSGSDPQDTKLILRTSPVRAWRLQIEMSWNSGGS